MINSIFQWCVDLLIWLAEALGMTYQEVNVWIFVIIWPLLFLVLIIIVILQQRKISQLSKRQ